MRSAGCAGGCTVAMLLVLISDEGGLAELNADRLGRLSRLGVTDVSVLRDSSTIGVVLNGWAFDPQRCAEQAATLVSGGREGRLLLPVMHAAVMPGVG